MFVQNLQEKTAMSIANPHESSAGLSNKRFASLTDLYEESPTAEHSQRFDVPLFSPQNDEHFNANRATKPDGEPRSMKIHANLGQDHGIVENSYISS